MGRTGTGIEKTINTDLLDKALAKAVYEGDIVNFRLIFMPLSPARKDSPERFETDKYAYLLPDEAMEHDGAFEECLAAVRQDETHRHILRELEEKRPAQLPSQLVLLLGDNAVRAGKYTSAAQAYELLRIRKRMQEEFYRQADEALEAGRVALAVRGYLVATGLEYDYAAFPEPLPAVPNYQTRALMLHGEYPETPEDCIGMQPLETHLRSALSYLLLVPDAASRLSDRPPEALISFIKELVLRKDPEWGSFVGRYREAAALAQSFALDSGPTKAEGGESAAAALEQEIAAQRLEDPTTIPARLLGRVVEGGEWWQYLKELAYKHPASALFIARQVIGEKEVVVPRCREDSPLGIALGLIEARA